MKAATSNLSFTEKKNTFEKIDILSTFKEFENSDQTHKVKHYPQLIA